LVSAGRFERRLVLQLVSIHLGPGDTPAVQQTLSPRHLREVVFATEGLDRGARSAAAIR
jgi:hypothetical protein